MLHKNIIIIVIALVLLTNCKEDKHQKNRTMEKSIIKENDIQNICQKAIDLPKLQKYYHIKELPKRSPLIILKNELLTANIKLNKFGKPVKLINDTNEIKSNDAYMTLNISFTDKTYFANISYPIEGVKAEIQFVKLNKEWNIKKSQLIEK